MYKFRAVSCLSSGGQIVWTQYNLTSWGWARYCSKHVRLKDRNKRIKNVCLKLVIVYNYTEMRGQRNIKINLMSEPPKYETLATRPLSCVPVSLPRCHGALSGHKLQATDDNAHCRVDHSDRCTGNLVPGTGKQPEQLFGIGSILVPGIGTWHDGSHVVPTVPPATKHCSAPGRQLSEGRGKLPRIMSSKR